MAPDPAEELALWRYPLIAEALDRRLGSRERGVIVRRIADEEHVGPDGQPRLVSRNTIDRWIRSYRQHGLAGLRDRPRSDQGGDHRAAALIEEAVKLRLEQPARSAAHLLDLTQRQALQRAACLLRSGFASGHQTSMANPGGRPVIHLAARHLPHRESTRYVVDEKMKALSIAVEDAGSSGVTPIKEERNADDQSR